MKRLLIVSLTLLLGITIVARADTIYLPIVNRGNQGDIIATSTATLVATTPPTAAATINPPSIATASPTIVATATPTTASAFTGHNVLLLIGDDLGVELLAGYGAGSDYPPTPNIDALFAQGVFFRNVWASPICSPTRATMLTGRYAFRTGVGSVIGGPDGGASMPLSEFTLPQAIKTDSELGYVTANIGKWHLSKLADGADMPNQMGYDHYAGVFAGTLPDYYAWTKVVDGVNQQVTNYATSETVDDAIAWLNTQNGARKPWFLWLAFNAPHTPFHKPSNELHSFDSLSGTQADINANPYPYYKAAIEAMDSEIGRLLSALPSEVRANTTIIFTGDNGTPRQVVQSPYNPNRAKGTLYEGGIHVPLVIAGPKVVNPGRESTALVNSVDIYATVLELLGLDVAKAIPADVTVDSVTMLPYIQNSQADSTRDWIFAQQFATTPLPSDGKTIRDDRFKLIRFDTGTEEFYDLATDTLEENNLLTAGVTGEAKTRYCALAQTMNDLLLSKPGTTVPALPDHCSAN